MHVAQKNDSKVSKQFKNLCVNQFKQLDYQLQRKIKTPFKCIGVTLLGFKDNKISFHKTIQFFSFVYRLALVNVHEPVDVDCIYC